MRAVALNQLRIGAEPRLRFSLSALIVCLTYSAATATTYTWDGNSGNGAGTDWSTSNNWSPNGAPPANAGHDLVFATGNKLGNNADGASWTLNSLSFATNAGAFTLGGSALYIGAGGVTNHSASLQTINNSIYLTANQTWTATSGGLSFGSSYNDAQGKNVTLSGAGDITVSGQMNNAGTLTLTGSGTRTFSGYTSVSNVNVQGSGTTTFIGQLSTSSTINISGSGNTTFNAYTSASTVNLTGAGSTSFGGQLNATSLNIDAGSNTFSTVYASTLTISSAADATFTDHLGANTFTIAGSGDVTIAGQVDYGSLILDGTGTTTLSGATNNNISSTTVNSGTLVMAQTEGAAINGSLLVNGGTVSFAGDNQIPSWSSVTLTEGSVLLLNDTIQSLQSLTISGDSIIDFGGSGSTLSIGAISVTNDAVLTIVNWNTAVDTFTAQSNPGSSIVQVSFDGGAAAGWTVDSGSITPIPEPAAYGAVLVGGLLGFAVWFRRRARSS